MRLLYFSGLVLATLSSTACTRQGADNVVDETFVHKYGVAVPSDYWTSSGRDGSVISTI